MVYLDNLNYIMTAPGPGSPLCNGHCAIMPLCAGRHVVMPWCAGHHAFGLLYAPFMPSRSCGLAVVPLAFVLSVLSRPSASRVMLLCGHVHGAMPGALLMQGGVHYCRPFWCKAKCSAGDPAGVGQSGDPADAGCCAVLRPCQPRKRCIHPPPSNPRLNPGALYQRNLTFQCHQPCVLACVGIFLCSPFSPSTLSHALVRTTHRSSATARPEWHTNSQGGAAGPPRGPICLNAVVAGFRGPVLPW